MSRPNRMQLSRYGSSIETSDTSSLVGLLGSTAPHSAQRNTTLTSASLPLEDSDVLEPFGDEMEHPDEVFQVDQGTSVSRRALGRKLREAEKRWRGGAVGSVVGPEASGAPSMGPSWRWPWSPPKPHLSGSDQRDLVVINEGGDSGRLEDNIDRDGLLITPELENAMSSLIEFAATDEVDPVELAISPEFTHYVAVAPEFYRIEVENLGMKARRSLFINMYNCLALHAWVIVSDRGRLSQASRSSRTSGNFAKGRVRTNVRMEQCAYNIGGYIYSMEDILHGILRCNNPPPKAFLGPYPWSKFLDNDRRASLRVKLEPRIHFLLNGRGSRGTLPDTNISYVVPVTLEKKLCEAATEYLSRRETIRMDERKTVVVLPDYFHEYVSDFCQETKLVEALLGYVQPGSVAHRELSAICTSRLSISFNSRRWTSSRGYD
eukprot:CAMPEP_0184687100 /NCGR_PEP_ID=MMETSP0312-20130426/25082_1 /TAXON_ID=31354 /ORGANISM="Compsopogon coeruleus, Strain SAG 36.94" /LENGTH=433 /DNA_ID=CAMNT_0027142839 /DNA_START=95 /DNA_END=1396 /DNA_ORIENTATION=-